MPKIQREEHQGMYHGEAEGHALALVASPRIIKLTTITAHHKGAVMDVDEITVARHPRAGACANLLDTDSSVSDEFCRAARNLVKAGLRVRLRQLAEVEDACAVIRALVFKVLSLRARRSLNELDLARVGLLACACGT